MLDIAASVLRSIEAERFATNECNRFGFDFAEVHWSGFGIHEFFFRGVPQNAMRDFMERRLVGDCRDGADSDFSTNGKALDIAVHLVKLSVADV